MRPYSERVKADASRWMSPPHRQSVVEIAQELGIHVITLLQVAEGLAVARSGGASALEWA